MRKRFATSSINRLFFAVSIATAFASPMASGQQPTETGRPSWKIDELIRILQAREESINSLAAKCQMVERVIPAGYAEYDAARRAAAKRPMNPAFDKEIDTTPAVTDIEIMLTRDGKMRQQIFDPKGESKLLHVFNGTDWKTRQGKDLIIQTGPNMRDLRQFFGLGFRNLGRAEIQPRADLHQTLADASKRNDVKSIERASDTQVKVVFRIPNAKEQPVKGWSFLYQIAIWFDETLGMAPVRFVAHEMMESKEEGKEDEIPTFWEGKWSDFSDFKNGVFLPKPRPGVLSRTRDLREGVAYGKAPQILQGLRHQDFCDQGEYGKGDIARRERTDSLRSLRSRGGRRHAGHGHCSRHLPRRRQYSIGSEKGDQLDGPLQSNQLHGLRDNPVRCDCAGAGVLSSTSQSVDDDCAPLPNALTLLVLGLRRTK